MLAIFLNNVLPPLLVIAAGFALDRALGVDARSLSRVALYILLPALIFATLIQSEVGGDELARIGLFVVAVTALMWACGLGVARLLGLDDRLTHAFLLATLFGNSGNYGLAVVLSAFGQAGLELGLVYFVASSLLTHTFGAYLASRGRYSMRQSVRNVLRLPLIYAIAAALVLRASGLRPPEPVLRALSLPQAGALPVMQILLGVQLARISHRLDLRFVGTATLVKLAGAAALSFALAALLGLRGLARSVSILETSMPTAVTTLVLSTEFGTRAEEVGGVVLLSTLLSPLALTAVLALLQ
ncbi:MAG: AEC family transporter [Anaerolineae bacterium]|nr:AEC family transporter [Anaerolineae bacterium]